MDVTLEREADDGVSVKIQAPAREVNGRATEDEPTRLVDIRLADWNRRRSLQVGESAEASVVWSYRDREVALMIGHDEETWDAAVTFPVEVVDSIVNELDQV